MHLAPSRFTLAAQFKSNIKDMSLTYRRHRNLFALIIFCIATTVYCLTIEPTASFWDCGEFILSAYKLEVGHPPGAPFFMLTANMFTQLTNDPTLAARMVNYMSALMSAATILFLYLSITHLVHKLVIREGREVSGSQALSIISSGVIGALVYTFSDTFWFSAVEGEVYAYSSLFTAAVFWLILRWEEEPDRRYADRWLILIAYLTGISIGVHLLNLLCLPAIVLVYYYKQKPEAGFKSIFLPLSVSGILLLVLLYGIVPGVIKVGSWFELLFVNHFGLPFHTGVIGYIILLAINIIWGIYEIYSHRSLLRAKLSYLSAIALLGIPFYGYGHTSWAIGGVVLLLLAYYLYSNKIPHRLRISTRVLFTSLICMMMFVIGYSSYALILIRSSANPPMDQNSPEDIFTLGSYLNREQYEHPPLFYGHSFASERKLKEENGYCYYDYKEKAPSYIRKVKESPEEKDRYIIAERNLQEIYAQQMLFPRMYSAAHANYGSNQTNLYKQWVDIRGKEVPYNRCGEQIMVNVPTQWENLKFFFSYQLNFMYWRYFLWNFVGRQNDIQGYGELENGNWITGIPFIDEMWVGNQEFIPTELKENKGRNVYYGLPLLLGLIGLLWQGTRGRTGTHSFLIVFFLFFMTGIAIILYLNQTPMQVRERDYAYAGSFYAFSIWVGMGVCGTIHLLKKYMKEWPASLIASVLCLIIPIQMAGQNWDDHDRSGRYSCRDFGQNYLISAQEESHPIIFNMGDNETFPLWYNQEVEGFRTDVRTCNLSYLAKDWYIDQMKRDAYTSPALPISWEKKEYVANTRNGILIRPEMKEQLEAYYRSAPEEARKEFGDNPFELSHILRYWVRSENEKMQIIPTDSLVIKLDREAIERSGMLIPESISHNFPEYMHISLKDQRYLTKSNLMMLEIIAGCNWERPVYITSAAGTEAFFCFTDNFIQEGLLYRITPFNTQQHHAQIDSEKTFDCLINKFKWGGIEKDIYLDENTLRMYANSRRLFAKLAETLIREGKHEKALQALDHCIHSIPPDKLPYDAQHGAITLAHCYYQLEQKDKGDVIITALAGKSIEYITWYQQMDHTKWPVVAQNCMYHFYLLDEEIKVMKKFNPQKATHYSEILNRFTASLR